MQKRENLTKFFFTIKFINSIESRSVTNQEVTPLYKPLKKPARNPPGPGQGAPGPPGSGGLQPGPPGSPGPGGLILLCKCTQSTMLPVGA